MPSSIPDTLIPFIDTRHLVSDQELVDFKKLLVSKEKL